MTQLLTTTRPLRLLWYANRAFAWLDCYRVDFGKLAEDLPEAKPRWNAREGAEELDLAIRQSGLKLEDSEGPRYKRIAHIRHLLSSGRLDETLRWRESVVGQTT